MSKGTLLQLRLRGAEKAELTGWVDNLQRQQGKSIKSVRLAPAENGEFKVLLEFNKPVAIVDETVLALPGKQSRWEIVVGSGEQSAPLLAAPSLSQIDAVRRDGRLDVVFSGSPGITAEAAFVEANNRLQVDLPEVPLAQASAAVARFRASGLIKSVKAIEAKGGARLVFELAEGADLIDTQGVIVNNQGQVVLSLVPDAKVDAGLPGGLGALGFEYGEGLMQMRLIGVPGQGRVNAYTIEDPPRLVVDFLGWKPEQIKSALANFDGKSVATLGAPRLDTTRLGSARAVFDLAVSAPFRSAKRTRQPVVTGDGLEDNVLISLVPGSPAMETLVRRGPLDLRYRRELHDGRQSDVVIRPPSLENAARYAMAAMRPEQSREFALLAMLNKAMENDAKFLAAKSEFDAAAEILPQARSAYLPQASFDYNRSNLRQNVIKAANRTFPTGVSEYPNVTMALTITQPLFKPQAWIKMDQAQLAVKQAELNLVVAEQDLILRVSTAYLNLLAATDGVELATAERESTEKQYEQAKSRMESGLGTIAQVHDMEARLSLTKAREIEAENRVDDARLAIKEIVGEAVSGVRGFKSGFAPAMPLPASVESWVDASIEQNLALQGRVLAVEIAAMEVARQKAGHLPTVSLVGSVSRQDAGGSLYGDGQRNQNGEVGVRFSLPITDGGMTLSMSREAVARREKANHEREQEHRRTERLTRSAYNGLVTSAKTLDALRQAVVAQESALETRIEGFNSGLYNVVAVMDAYRLYYTAQRDFFQSRYDYLLNRLKLKQAVGTLSRKDLEDISALLQ